MNDRDKMALAAWERRLAEARAAASGEARASAELTAKLASIRAHAAAVEAEIAGLPAATEKARRYVATCCREIDAITARELAARKRQQARDLREQLAELDRKLARR